MSVIMIIQPTYNTSLNATLCQISLNAWRLPRLWFMLNARLRVRYKLSYYYHYYYYKNICVKVNWSDHVLDLWLLTLKTFTAVSNPTNIVNICASKYVNVNL